ncbi:hypothetical protein K439DRAFT_514369 [Ramaria rubella]|nr:hypothetical protein K439DRAFT_514369 [Ramaria rubella]
MDYKLFQEFNIRRIVSCPHSSRNRCSSPGVGVLGCHWELFSLRVACAPIPVHEAYASGLGMSTVNLARTFEEPEDRGKISNTAPHGEYASRWTRPSPTARSPDPNFSFLITPIGLCASVRIGLQGLTAA